MDNLQAARLIEECVDDLRRINHTIGKAHTHYKLEAIRSRLDPYKTQQKASYAALESRYQENNKYMNYVMLTLDACIKSLKGENT